MRQAHLLVGLGGTLALASVSTWLFAAEARGPLPRGDWDPRSERVLLLTGPDSEALRRDALRRAHVFMPAGPRLDVIGPRRGTRPMYASDPLICRYLNETPSGTSAKFNCVLDGGDVIKVKYSRNPEIHAEAAASRLLRALGYAADEVWIVPRLRCYGCPRYPFFTAQLLALARTSDALAPNGYDNAYSDFEWVAVERRFDAPAIETETQTGWGWFELKHSIAPRADIDALRLLAVFLAHWDNKADNQRLVCLDEGPVADNQVCAKPLLMIHDLGATFGPTKVNLAGWHDRPVWADRQECLVSMRALPWKGATFGDVQITEDGRVELARRLSALSDDAVTDVFREARFQDYYSGTDDGADLDAWAGAFRYRVDQILTAGPCPESLQSDP